MDTPLAATVHKENVHIGGGKATVTKKPDKLKTAKTFGQKRKALADLRSTYVQVAGASKDVELKQKSVMKGNEVEKNQKTHGKHHTAAANRTTKKHPVSTLSKGANLNSKSVLTPNNHILTDEEIKKCYEWAKDGIEQMGGYSWSAKDETKLLRNQTLSEIMASAIGVPISELEQPLLDEEGYEPEESDFNCAISVSGRYSSTCIPQEPYDDSFGVAGIVLEEYPLPELKLDDCGEFNISNDGGIDGTQPFGSIRAAI